ncbi:hypothetical protein D0469_11100 [Peribacillus saganii]|uniref:Uncharacterized protein n=1 Tax=Peribacillus saganii TaxID=2303992 RepID=A0A372LQF2_9BACI|nr:hypothetical protein [Peribacillus saganii]RFU69019.1 hypothetical protein D0469_11100 [Peribacillus saganii]
MPEDRRQPHVEATPHFDGANEGIENDPTGTAGSQMGIVVDTRKEFSQNRNEIQIDLETSDDMKEFEKMTRGKKLENI